MHFYSHCPVDHGYIQGGEILPSPLDQFPQFGLLPTEIQLKILEDTFGDTVRGLAWLEQVSHLWQDYVLHYLWPGFVKKKFTEAQIEGAKNILTRLNQALTPKNIYHVLSVPPLISMSPAGERSVLGVTFKADRSFILYTGNDGPGNTAVSLMEQHDKTRPLYMQVVPGNHFVAERLLPSGRYVLSLICFGEQGCTAYVGVFYVNDPTFSQPTIIPWWENTD